MDLTIKNVRAATSAEWDQYWDFSSHATYFQSRAWSEVWNLYSKGKISSAPLHFSFSDGFQAVLPTSIEQKGPIFPKTSLMSPGCNYGGILYQDSLGAQHIKCIAEYVSEEFTNLVWRINPFDPLSKVLEIEQLNLTRILDDHTRVIELNRPIEIIFKTWSKGHRSAVKKAQKEGISIFQAEKEEQWRNYFEIYRILRKHWESHGERATSDYRWEFFSALFQQNSENVKLWLAKHQQQIIAGALIFYAPRHIVYWHGASNPSFFNLSPANLLIYEIIKDCAETKYTWFDFNPSGGHQGSDAFKKSFDSVAHSCPLLFNENALKRIIKPLVRGLRYR